MKGHRGLAAVAMAGLAATGIGACGGGERQDANEPEGNFRIEVTRASFPQKQSLADETTLKIDVRNADDKAAPNVAVTIETDAADGGGAPQAFSYDLKRSDVSDPSRPIWVLDDAPDGGDTAYTNTWALGRLEPGQTKKFRWKLTAVHPGTYTVGYSASPGLTGKAKPAGGDTQGSFRVNISAEPPDARVDAAGNVVRGSGSQD